MTWTSSLVLDIHKGPHAGFDFPLIWSDRNAHPSGRDQPNHMFNGATLAQILPPQAGYGSVNYSNGNSGQNHLVTLPGTPPIRFMRDITAASGHLFSFSQPVIRWDGQNYLWERVYEGLGDDDDEDTRIYRCTLLRETVTNPLQRTRIKITEESTTGISVKITLSSRDQREALYELKFCVASLVQLCGLYPLTVCAPLNGRNFAEVLPSYAGSSECRLTVGEMPEVAMDNFNFDSLRAWNVIWRGIGDSFATINLHLIKTIAPTLDGSLQFKAKGLTEEQQLQIASERLLHITHCGDENLEKCRHRLCSKALSSHVYRFRSPSTKRAYLIVKFVEDHERFYIYNDDSKEQYPAISGQCIFGPLSVIEVYDGRRGPYPWRLRVSTSLACSDGGRNIDPSADMGAKEFIAIALMLTRPKHPGGKWECY